MPGIIFRTNTRARALIAGAKTASPEFPISNSGSVSPSLSGMNAIAFLKERFFGLTGPQGNHGEDVKEIYFYTDCTPSHSYMRMVYRYPHAAFPYEELVAMNVGRSKLEAEFELWDSGVLENGYFDIDIEYRESCAGRYSRARDRDQLRRQASDAASAPDTLVSQYLELGT